MISKITKAFKLCVVLFLLPIYAYAIPFSELDFDADDLGYHISIEFSDYSIEMTEIKKSKDAIQGEATFRCGTEEHSAKIFFPKFALYRDGSFKSGNCDKEDSTYRLNKNIEFFLDKVSLEKSDDSYIIKSKNAFVQHQMFYGKPLLNAELSFDVKGNILSISRIRTAKNIKLTSEDDYNITILLNSITYDGDENICAGGSVSVPPLKLQFSAGSNQISSENGITIKTEEPFTFSFNDDNFKAKSFTALTKKGKNPSRYYLDDVSIIQNDKEYYLGEVFYIDSGDFLSLFAPGAVTEENREYLLPDDILTGYYYYQNGLYSTFKTKFPRAKDYSLTITTFKYLDIYAYEISKKDLVRLWYGDTYIEPSRLMMQEKQPQDIYFDLNTECFRINHGKFVFPKNCALGNFTADYIDIDKE